MTNKIQINLRVTEELLQKLRAQAQAKNRTVNNFIETVLIQYINEKEADK